MMFSPMVFNRNKFLDFKVKFKSNTFECFSDNALFSSVLVKKINIIINVNMVQVVLFSNILCIIVYYETI